jgi:hypothetical protein
MSQINWVKGTLHGKLGAIVGSSYYGKPYTKTYTPPTNRNTPEQQEIRALFQRLGHIAKAINGVLKEYTRPMLINKHPANHLIHLNKPMFAPVETGHRWDPEKFVFMDGELAPDAIVSATLNKTEHTARISWDTQSEASDDDVAIGIIYDNETRKTMYSIETRIAQQMNIDVSPLANVSSYTEIYAYLAFASSITNSPTTHLLVTVFEGKSKE